MPVTTGRRELIAALGGMAAAWPLVARAQQAERMRRIGVLSGPAADDQDNELRLASFQQRLQQLGWTDGDNVQIDYRFAAANLENYHKYAAELVALAPDVILAPGTSLVHILQATRTIPIVFPIAADPVGSGLVESLSRPGGNATGFLQRFERKMAGDAQRDRAGRDASSGPSGPHRSHRDRPVRRHPVRGAVGWRGGEPAQPARRQRDRARRHGIRAFEQWRSDSGGKRVGDCSAQYDRRACSSPQTAHGLLRTLVRCWRRSDLVWS